MLSLVFTSATWAQENDSNYASPSIGGWVREDNGGGGIPLVKVLLLHGDSQIAVTQTDLEGRFLLEIKSKGLLGGVGYKIKVIGAPNYSNEELILTKFVEGTYRIYVTSQVFGKPFEVIPEKRKGLLGIRLFGKKKRD